MYVYLYICITHTDPCIHTYICQSDMTIYFYYSNKTFPSEHFFNEMIIKRALYFLTFNNDTEYITVFYLPFKSFLGVTLRNKKKLYR